MDPMTAEFILGHVNYWLFVIVNDDRALHRDCQRQFGKKNRWLEHLSGVGVYAVHLGG